MAIVRWFGENDLWKRMEQMQSDMERIWSQFSPHSATGHGVFPPMNIYDNGESFIVRAEVPGVNPKDIDITVASDTLNIRGKRELKAECQEGCYHRRERKGGDFRRAFTLPTAVDATKVQAQVANGILEIRLPRAEQAKMRKIEIQAK